MNEKLTFGADGFPEHEVLDRVATRLQVIEPTLGAFVQHTGGGNMCIEIPLPEKDLRMYWGIVDEVWGYDLNSSSDGEPIDAGFIDLQSDTSDIGLIAEKILQTVSEHRQG
jgi:hypothetical protein